jgi:5-methylcytosine-specific restriction endonuclease McrA
MKWQVLVLNIDFQPYDIWDWQHSMSKLLCTDSVRALYDENGMIRYDDTIRDGRGNVYELPAILVLTEYMSCHSGQAPYTKMNIFARDLFVCQYCGELTTPNNRSVDHVIPRAHWNFRRYHFKLSSFENVVTCCSACNKHKRNRTPNQAGMQLIRKPKRISRAQAYKNKLSLLKNKPVQWLPYLNLSEKEQYVEEKV